MMTTGNSIPLLAILKLISDLATTEEDQHSRVLMEFPNRIAFNSFHFNHFGANLSLRGIFYDSLTGLWMSGSRDSWGMSRTEAECNYYGD